MFPLASRLLTHGRSRDFFSTPLDHYLTLGQQVVFQSLELQEVPISVKNHRLHFIIAEMENDEILCESDKSHDDDDAINEIIDRRDVQKPPSGQLLRHEREPVPSTSSNPPRSPEVDMQPQLPLTVSAPGGRCPVSQVTREFEERNWENQLCQWRSKNKIAKKMKMVRTFIG